MSTTRLSHQDTPPTLTDLPSSVLILIAEKLISLCNGSPRDVIKLALVHSTLWKLMAGSTLTKGVWADQCRRLGWASKLEPGLLDWNFFCARMRYRWKLRRKLRQYCSFLDVRSFSAVRPGASVICLQTIESKIGRPLPWSMFELWRWADGQDARDRGGVQFLNGARLLSSSEALELGGYCLDARPLIPFTDEIRGRKRYCMDLDGKVWLCSGFNTLHVADSLYELLHRSLI